MIYDYSDSDLQSEFNKKKELIEHYQLLRIKAIDSENLQAFQQYDDSMTQAFRELYDMRKELRKRGLL